MESLKGCDVPGCGREEFLVWRCSRCRGEFCELHRSEEQHQCREEDHAAVSRNYGEELKGNIQCQNQSGEDEVKGGVSVKEMLEDVERRHEGLLKYPSREHYSIKSSSLPEDEIMKKTLKKVEHVDNIIDTSKSEKQKKIAKSTKNILLRSRAIGKDEIPNEDRVYIVCKFPLSNSSKCFFFSRTTTVGSALRYIGEKHSLLAFGSPVCPDTSTLCFYHKSGDKDVDLDWIKDNYISTYIDDEFMELGVRVISIKDSILAQSKMTEKASMRTDSAHEAGNTPRIFKKGDKVVYKNSEIAVIVGVHREEYPPYYTIHLQGQGEEFKEKQTVSTNLKAFQEPTDKTSSFFPEQEVSDPESVIKVRLSFKGKVKELTNIPILGTVSDLKLIVSKYTGIFPSKQKLLHKGKVLKDGAMLRGSNEAVMKHQKPLFINDNDLIMLMSSSK